MGIASLSPSRVTTRRAPVRRAPAVSLVVANGNASRVTPALLEAVRTGLRTGRRAPALVVTRSPAELDALLPRDPEQRVALVGGDGTVHAAAALGPSLPQLALVPAGGAGNIARSLGIPADLGGALAVARHGAAQSFDVIHATGAAGAGAVVEGVSVGALAEARAHYRGRNSTARGRALLGGVRALAAHRPVPLRVELDGRGHELLLSQLFIANTPLYGPGLRVAPGAVTDDGLLDVVGHPPLGRWELVRLFGRLRRGAAPTPGVRRWRARRVDVVPLAPTAAFGDSRALGPGRLRLEAVPGALFLVRPR